MELNFDRSEREKNLYQFEDKANRKALRQCMPILGKTVQVVGY